MARVALIDGDSFAYRCAAAVERTKYFVEYNDARKSPEKFDSHADAKVALDENDGAVLWSRREVGTLKDAADILERAIERSISRAQASVFHVYIGGNGPTFRDHLARIRRYKGNRASKPVPTYLGDLRSYLLRYWGGVMASGEEVDDVLSYMAREVEGNGGTPIVIGNDKDLDQIPGEHYDWVKDTTYTIDDAGSRLRLWMQVLHGDVADNVLGCCGIGTVRAEAIVKQCIDDGWSDETMWDLVCAAYEKSQGSAKCLYQGLDPVDVATEMYNLVRLKHHRHEEWTYAGLFPKPKTVQEKKNPQDQSCTLSIDGKRKESTSRTCESSAAAQAQVEVQVEVRGYDSSRPGEEGNCI